MLLRVIESYEGEYAMKKLLTIILSLVFSMCIAACGETEPPRKSTTIADAVSQIYEIELSDYSELNRYELFYHENVISKEFIYTQELPNGTAATFKTDKREYGLTYLETVFLPVGDYKAHDYSIDGDEDSFVRLREDGRITFIKNYPIAKLDIDPHASPNEVRIALGPALSDLIDLSQFNFYEEISVDTSTEEGFGEYTFSFYRTFQGYLTNFAMISINDDGVVYLLRNQNDNTDIEEYCANIDKELEEKLILAKLEGMYNTEETEYTEHKILDDPASKSVFRYNNEVCIQYEVVCKVYISKEDCSDFVGCTLLIPVRLLYGEGDPVTTE